MTQLPNKDPAEVVTITFDYALELGTETISTAAVSISVVSGTDPNPNDLLNGGATISGAYVYQSIKAGLAGVCYKLRCLIETSAARKLVLTGQFEVQTA